MTQKNTHYHQIAPDPANSTRIRSASFDETELQPGRAVPRPRLRRVVLCAAFFFFLAALGIVWKVGATFSVISQNKKPALSRSEAGLPLADPREHDRLDVLLLGIRGEGDPHGGLLTDTIVLLSFKLDTKQIAMISVPRDTYLKIPIVDKEAKINEAYELGNAIDPDGGGLALAKIAVEQILGVNIDYAATVNFRAFEELVDILDGITVQAAKPLHENLQWGGIDFFVPAGSQRMDGETALYYVRSRFTTSDFDRARRQQEVLLGIRDKMLELGFVTNPKKMLAVLDTLGRNIRTDFDFSDFSEVVEIAQGLRDAPVRRLVLDAAESNLLAAASFNGAYVLVPKTGNFSEIKNRARNIFTESSQNSTLSPSSEPSSGGQSF